MLESAHDVLSCLGPGLSECTYQNALCEALRLQGLIVEREVMIPVRYERIFCGFIRADVIVDKSLCLELKAKASLTPSDRVQAATYMKHNSELTQCLLLNFGAEISSVLLP